MNKREIGKIWEDKAEKVLITNGHKILTRNYKKGRGEIDIISDDNGTIVFTEVKYRSTVAKGYGEEAVDARKARRIYETANIYLTKKNLLEKDVRFDIISFTAGGFNWIKNSFWGDEIGL